MWIKMEAMLGSRMEERGRWARKGVPAKGFTAERLVKSMVSRLAKARQDKLEKAHETFQAAMESHVAKYQAKHRQEYEKDPAGYERGLAVHKQRLASALAAYTLGHSRVQVVTAGANALGRLGIHAQEAVPALRKLGQSHPDVWVKSTASLAIADIQPTRKHEALEAYRRESTAYHNLAVAEPFATERANPVDAWLKDMENPDKRVDAIHIIHIHADKRDIPRVLPKLVELGLKSKEDGVRQAATDAMNQMGEAAIRPLTQHVLNDGRTSIRLSAIEALGHLGPKSVPSLTPMLRHPDRDTREAARRELLKIDTPLARRVVHKADETIERERRATLTLQRRGTVRLTA